MNKRLLTLLLLLLGAPVRAAPEPLLLLEPGAHTAPVRSLSADAEGRYLVTGADDHTVRVWDLYSKSLLRVLRLPTRPVPRSPDRIEAVALSPDGRQVAALCGNLGGATLYLFDRERGDLVRRVSAPPVAGGMAFSRDGERLALALSQDGVLLLGVKSGAEMGRAAGCKGKSLGVDLARAGQLVASCDDGVVRLYDAALRPLGEAANPGAHGVRFSPDGGRVAVGYLDGIAVRSGRDLSLLYHPSLAGVGGDLRLVGWSSDGGHLYAGGGLRAGNVPVVRGWEAGGQVRSLDLPVSSGALADLVVLPGGSLAYAADGPGWAVYSGYQHRVHLQPAAQADFRQGDLLLSESGARVRFSYGPRGGAPALFSLEEYSLTLDPPAAARLRPTIRAGLALTGWKDTAEVRLAGAPLLLRPDETSRDLALAPDGRSFVLGTDRALRAFESDGSARWEAALPAPAHTINISGDGRVVVAALGDGTIRWYSAAEGKPLLVLFPHADRRRWAAFTPSGYFHASASGGDDLIGWQIDRGIDRAADFVSASLLRRHRDRPDVLGRMLHTLDEGRAVVEADAEAERGPSPPLAQQLPPLLTVLEPRDGATVYKGQVTLRVAVRSLSGAPVVALRALVQGRTAQTRGLSLGAAGRGAGTEEQVQTLTVTIPEENCTLAVLAETESARSAPALVHLRFGGTPSAVEEVKPRLYALAVGVSRYRQTDLHLDYPAKDAGDMAAALREQQGRRYRSVEARVLADEGATRASILAGVAWLRRQTGPGDVAVLFLAGHGINDPGSGQYYFLPHEADMDAGSRSFLPGGALQEALGSVAGKVLLFLDTCHAGNVLDPSRRRVITDLSRFVGELSSTESGVVVYTASSGRQLSRESAQWGNGAFTKAAVEGLRGKADTKRTGRITVSMLETYISDRVRELTRDEQTPTTAKPGTVPDFLVVTVTPRPLLYKRWWFWGSLAAGAIALGAGIGLGSFYGAPRDDRTVVDFSMGQ